MAIPVQNSVQTNVRGPFAGMIAVDRLRDKMSGFALADAKASGAALLKGADWGECVFFNNWKNRTIVPSGTSSTGTRAAGTRTNYVDGLICHEHYELGTFKKEDSLPILRKGVIWTSQTVGTIVAGDPVYWDTSAGKLATGTGSAAGDLLLYGFNFLTGGSAGSLVMLEVNLPGYSVVKT